MFKFEEELKYKTSCGWEYILPELEQCPGTNCVKYEGYRYCPNCGRRIQGEE